MSSVEESSLVEPNHIPFLDSTHGPSPEPRTSKVRLIHPSEFPIEFKDYGDTSKLLRHKKFTHPPKEVFPKIQPREWLMEVKRSSEAIWILSPFTTIPCSLRGIVVKALHNPTVETNIMSEFLVETLLGTMPLVSTNKLFRSPSGLIFECCGIARAVLIRLDKNGSLDFRIYGLVHFAEKPWLKVLFINLL